MTPRDRRYALIDSPLGTLTLTAVGDGLAGVHFGRPDLSSACAMQSERDPVLSATAHQLEEYFAGERTEFDLALHLEGTEFQVAAWRALALAPFGATMSYTEQATALGRPRAVRAVGSANSRNPVAIVLPCHRVVGANGSLTGYAGGLDTKKWLLDHEAAVIGRSTAHTKADPVSGRSTAGLAPERMAV